MTERERIKEAFLKKIADDRYNRATHMIFADWLEENGYDDEAVVQRAWTKETQEAEDWLREFAAYINKEGDEYYGEYGMMTYENLLEVASNYLETGDVYCLPFDAPDRVYSDRGEFWKHFKTVTGRDVPEDRQDQIFRCAC